MGSRLKIFIGTGLQQKAPFASLTKESLKAKKYLDGEEDLGSDHFDDDDKVKMVPLRRQAERFFIGLRQPAVPLWSDSVFLTKNERFNQKSGKLLYHLK